MPYQEAYALNNITIFYLSDFFIYWFYKPFVAKQRLIGGIALARVADTIVLGLGFFVMGRSAGGLWSLLLLATLIWGGLCLGLLVFKYRKLLKRRFAQVFALTLLGWALEWLALALIFLFHRGGGDQFFSVGLKSIFNAFVIGPNLMYQWFFLIHFVVGFASLLLIKYKKD